jgi:5-methyltetrahydropteroyltriglutamate--homocysteine methyltransferase
VVGRQNVIAGSDCGFSSQDTKEPEIHLTVVVSKLKTMVEGAALASKQLLG